MDPPALWIRAKGAQEIHDEAAHMHGAWLLVIFLGTLALACHPECTTQCNDLVYAAFFRPACRLPVCEIQCENDEDVASCDPPRCYVACPANQCESDSCPQCETRCLPAVCNGIGAVCSPLCEETECGWRPFPVPYHQQSACEATCEHAACEVGLEDDANFTTIFSFNNTLTSDSQWNHSPLSRLMIFCLTAVTCVMILQLMRD